MIISGVSSFAHSPLAYDKNRLFFLAQLFDLLCGFLDLFVFANNFHVRGGTYIKDAVLTAGFNIGRRRSRTQLCQNHLIKGLAELRLLLQQAVQLVLVQFEKAQIGVGNHRVTSGFTCKQGALTKIVTLFDLINDSFASLVVKLNDTHRPGIKVVHGFREGILPHNHRILWKKPDGKTFRQKLFSFPIQQTQQVALPHEGDFVIQRYIGIHLGEQQL